MMNVVYSYPDELKGMVTLPTLYPNNFLDPASLHIPNNIKAIYKLARYFYLTNPLVSAAIYKLAEYPITDLVYDTSDERLREIYRTILEERMDIKRVLVEIGINYNVYGIVFMSIVAPFERTFKGKISGKTYTPQITKRGPNWYKRDGKLYFKPNDEEVEIIDTPVSKYDFKIVLWDPMQVEIDYNEFIDEGEYYYTIPQKTMRKFATSPLFLQQTPRPFLDAWLHGKSTIKFNPANFIVIKRPSPIMSFKGWGIPLLAHVLQPLHYQQMLRRAQYAIAKERTVPLRYLFPPPELINAQNPFAINLKQWKEQVTRALMMWKINPNYIGIFPVPVQQAALSGEGKSLMLFPEINALSEEIIQGLQVPIEFLKGGLSWSGTSVSLRMLENHFLNYRQGLKRLFNFIVRIVSASLHIEPIDIYLLPFKMADDIQRKQMMQALYQLQAISKHTLLDAFELDYENEHEKIKKEVEDAAELQRKQALAQAKVQQEIQQLAPDYEEMLVQENIPLGPEANLFMRKDIEGIMPPQPAPPPDMRPLPEKNPPRRKESPV